MTLTSTVAPARLPGSKPSPVATPLGVILAACAVAAPLTLSSEGSVNHGYRDPVNIVTECSGHTAGASMDHKDIPPAVCAAELSADELAHGQAIAACIRVQIPLK